MKGLGKRKKSNAFPRLNKPFTHFLKILLTHVKVVKFTLLRT